MIGRLAGQLAHRGTDHVMIDVGGVGYLVHCSDRTLSRLPSNGSFVTLWTDLLVREDLMQLMGFETLAEKEWYRLLTSVQGVGAKAALAILGALGADGVSRAIALADAGAVRAAPGIGPKLAQRVVNELKDKAPSMMALSVAEPAPAPPGIAGPALAPAVPQASAQADALSALANLGYGASEAAGAIASAAAADPEADTSALIREALRRLAPAG